MVLLTVPSSIVTDGVRADAGVRHFVGASVAQKLIVDGMRHIDIDIMPHGLFGPVEVTSIAASKVLGIETSRQVVFQVVPQIAAFPVPVTVIQQSIFALLVPVLQMVFQELIDPRVVSEELFWIGDGQVSRCSDRTNVLRIALR